ncbi:MAG: RagB/SusD family nutrient uptake outer membrane protein, partial [Prevotella sp.]|nr:RagB/SusD family nutrient uptake outer membrane protein [Prevotella sp.]
MKAIYQFIFASLLLGGFTSCNDMLDTVPQGQFTSEQLDENSVEGLLASAYAGLEAHFFGNNEAFAGPSTNWIFDVRSDDAYKGGGGTGMEENIHLLEVSEINSDNISCLNKWQNNYYAISRVHNAMLAVKQATSISNADELMGELKTLRAWYYFDLIRIFNRIPYFTEDEDVNTKPNDEYTRDEIFSFIKRDLAEAIEVLPAQKSSAGRITKTTAQAMMAKVCAFTGSWEDVKTYADAVINSGQYSLYANFGDLSQIDKNNGSESIFALQCSTANDNAHINWSNLLNCTYSDGNLYGTGDEKYEMRITGSGRFADGTKYETTYEGVIPTLERRYNDPKISEFMKHDIERFMRVRECQTCHGARLKPAVLAVTVHDLNIVDMCNLDVDATLEILSQDLGFTESEELIAKPILKEIRERVKFMQDVGLGYLELGRSANTLSGG